MALDLMREFLNEAYEQLDILEHLFLELEKKDSRTIDAIFRVAHTLKGSAACVGLKDIAEFAHKMETLLDSIRKGEVVISESVCNLLLQAGDVLRSLVRGVEEGVGSCIPSVFSSIAKELESASLGNLIAPQKGEKNSESKKVLIRVTLDEASDMRGARAFVILKRLEEIGELKFSKPTENELLSGRVLPTVITAVMEGNIDEPHLYECIEGYPDVKGVDVGYIVEVREDNWSKYREYGYTLQAQGKRVVLDFAPGVLKLDNGSLRLLGDAMRQGWILYSVDDLTYKVLSRITLKKLL
ncbi:two-component system, chemotaxis family, sensor kinase CheA [Thermanaeromonas toyohensis ToBE]|uniref:Two-component system, chemotaxis family, sensor kinase CheA n=1 Tax=Thermanaeromonas toyohensis ToBE TaxID=698762 RepID=A0A1W1VXM6_9FIRM|nr:Hpt domain-containing protein [Thermanaeromonas toyohensis]SMB97841.1 two-component system, chemotaxis family, sensor kinase CheA [Thermanaeromonas toyohensis ToBE]